jgi:septal ring factor EnvC (AmiA/AmiB activator)
VRLNKAAPWNTGAAGLAVLLAAAVLASAAPASAAPAKSPPGVSSNASGDLDAVRQECIAAARDAQQHERAVAALEHAIDLIGRDAEGRQRDLDDSRPEQASLLGALLCLARNPPERPAFAPTAAIERIRGELLLQGTLPALRAEAHALADEIEQTAALRGKIAAKKGELAEARQALEDDRGHLAEVIARRLALTRRILPEEPGGDARIAKLGHEASDIGDLIKRADAAAERRDKEILAHARAALSAEKAGALTSENADPTRPHQLHAFDPPESALIMPVSGTIVRRFGAADTAKDAAAAASQGLSLVTPAGAEAVAPFDGRVIYAGPFGNLGLVLIIRHRGLYHSLLAGLERVDVKADQWVLAGEPVGAMPKASADTLYFEVRRDAHPVDPQPWLALGDAGRDEPDGDQRVRE